MSTRADRALTAEVRLGPERFFWAEIHPEGLTGSGVRGARRRRQLGFLFESVLPVPIESVHAVYSRLPNERVLACAMLRTELAEVASGALLLGPDRLPGFLQHHATSEAELVRADSINLLTDEFEPAALRRFRSGWLTQVVATMVLCTLILVLGIERRTWMARVETDERAAAIEGLYESVLGPPEPSTAQPQSALLLAELRVSRRAVEAIDRVHAPEDASPGLAALLGHWPNELEAQTDTVQATADRITLAVRLADTKAADDLERALGGVNGWSIGQRSLRRSREGVELRLPLARQARSAE